MSHLIPLLSWHRICTGTRGVSPDNKDFVEYAPGGVRLEIEPAVKSEQFLNPDMPWEKPGLGFSQIMKDNGMFRLWYTAGKSSKGLCHAESDDAFTWHRTNLGLTEFEGSTANNICRHGNGFEGSIFLDPTASADERYKMIYQNLRWYDDKDKEISAEEGEKLWRAGGGGYKFKGFLCGSVSPDGLSWRELPKTLLNYFCDTQNVGFYDAERRRYVAFLRAHGPRGRVIGFSETEDFQTWPAPRIVMQPDADDSPDIDFYSNGYSPYPDADGVHVMFPGIYHHISDRVDARLAVAYKWKGWAWKEPQFSWEHWAWVERRAIIANGPEGSCDEGGIYPGPGLFRLPDGRMGVLCCAGTKRHNDPSPHPYGLQWALWKKDRLAGMRADKDGQFTIDLPVSGGPIRLNYSTEAGGWIKAELIPGIHYPARQFPPIAGYSFDQSDPLTGDALDRPLAWKGQDKLPAGAKSAQVNIRMHRAKIFAFMT